MTLTWQWMQERQYWLHELIVITNFIGSLNKTIETLNFPPDKDSSHCLRFVIRKVYVGGIVGENSKFNEHLSIPDNNWVPGNKTNSKLLIKNKDHNGISCECLQKTMEQSRKMTKLLKMPSFILLLETIQCKYAIINRCEPLSNGNKYSWCEDRLNYSVSHIYIWMSSFQAIMQNRVQLQACVSTQFFIIIYLWILSPALNFTLTTQHSSGRVYPQSSYSSYIVLGRNLNNKNCNLWPWKT